MKKIKQQTQIAPSSVYDDTLPAGVALETGAESIQDELNAIRSQLKRLGGMANWHDAPAPAEVDPPRRFRLIESEEMYTNPPTSGSGIFIHAKSSVDVFSFHNGYPSYCHVYGAQILDSSGSGSKYSIHHNTSIETSEEDFCFKVAARLHMLNPHAGIRLSVGFANSPGAFALRCGVDLNYVGSDMVASGYADGDGAVVTDTSQIILPNVFYTFEVEATKLNHRFTIYDRNGDRVWTETLVSNLHNIGSLYPYMEVKSGSADKITIAVVDSIELFSA